MKTKNILKLLLILALFYIKTSKFFKYAKKEKK